MINTPLTKRLHMKRPILLAGMANISLAPLAAAVSNAGGMGVMGGALLTPETLQTQITELKSLLKSPHLPWGIDLLLPKVGGTARATNKDYTRGTLSALVDIMVKEKPTLFVCAVGIPPKWVVDKLHSVGIYVMNMVGSPKHVKKALAVGVDIICAQGTEAGGHTGDIATMPLIPLCVDECAGFKSPLDNQPVAVVGAGGIFDGRGVAAALSLGAQSVWVGTRFVCAEESSVGPRHKNTIINSKSDETIRTTIFSGRPMRVYKSDYINNWETQRQKERDALLRDGKLPYKNDLGLNKAKGTPLDFMDTYPIIFGQASGGIRKVQPAAEIVNEMTTEAYRIMMNNSVQYLSKM